VVLSFVLPSSKQQKYFSAASVPTEYLNYEVFIMVQKQIYYAGLLF